MSSPSSKPSPGSPRLRPEDRFLAFTEAHPEARDPASFELLRRENDTPGYDLQSWPVFLDSEESDEMKTKCVGLGRLVGSLPRRLFDNDPERIAEVYRIEGGELFAEMILDAPNGIETALFRGDYVQTREGLRCLEMNAGSGVSGWELSRLAPLYSRVPVLAQFLAGEGLRLEAVDTLRATFAHFLDTVLGNPKLRDDPELHLAIPVSIDDDDLYNSAVEATCRKAYEEVLAELAPGRRGTVFFCDYGELAFDGLEVLCQGRRVQALFEQQTDSSAASRRTFGSFKAGELELFTGPATRLITSKVNLALLSENATSAVFDDGERALVESVVPWTRRVLRRGITPGDLNPESTENGENAKRVDTAELLTREKDRLVLKKTISHSGKDVHLGWTLGAAAWEERVGTALEEEGRWIVQERVEAIDRLLLDPEAGPVPHEVVWGLFVFGDAFRGGFVRVLPRDRQGLVSIPHGALSLPFFETLPV